MAAILYVCLSKIYIVYKRKRKCSSSNSIHIWGLYCQYKLHYNLEQYAILIHRAIRNCTILIYTRMCIKIHTIAWNRAIFHIRSNIWDQKVNLNLIIVKSHCLNTQLFEDILYILHTQVGSTYIHKENRKLNLVCIASLLRNIGFIIKCGHCIPIFQFLLMWV